MTIKGVLTLFIYLSAGFAAWSQPLCAEANLHRLVIGIDHVPIVVRDLNEAKTLFSDRLKFTVKNGREHEGISKFFVKFQDGTIWSSSHRWIVHSLLATTIQIF